jgi:phosphoglucosamine mutase|uniref:Phosphoglucosamine mutase n=1 Tax=Mesoaciditoga lauensis TaxID=1495039 RepID=A0A7V3RE98_9BACT
MKKYFGTDGVRGIANEELTAEFAFKIGRATAYVLEAHAHAFKEILIARDTRISGEMFESSLTSSLLSMGLNVTLCGIMPTPTLAWLTKKAHTVGLMVSASHNPWMHNGIKIFSNGYKLPDLLEEEIESHLDDEFTSKGKPVGRIVRSDMLSAYIEWLSKRYRELKGIRVAFDLANGAAISTVPYVMREIGIDATIFNAEPDGININENCGALHPEFMIQKMRSSVSEYGIIHDGDADRCIMVGKNGNVIDGDDTIVMNALSMKKEERLKNNCVIGTVMTNFAIEKYLKSMGIEFLRTQVGDRYVLERMIETGSVLGGEQSGHVIFLDLETTGDGLLTALETLRAARILNIDPESFSQTIQRYPQLLINVKVDDKVKVMKNEKLLKFIKDIGNDEEMRIILRPSGTEPLIRIMVEGKDEQKVKKVAFEAKNIIEEVNEAGKIHKN